MHEAQNTTMNDFLTSDSSPLQLKTAKWSSNFLIAKKSPTQSSHHRSGLAKMPGSKANNKFYPYPQAHLLTKY
jgi:hypothetical protein